MHGTVSPALEVLDTLLATHTFLVGERLTHADLVLAGLIQHSTKFTIDAALRKTFPRTICHLETIVNQPKLAEIYGPIEHVLAKRTVEGVKPEKKKKDQRPS